ncbi:MAG: hypothetical protein HYR55_13995 [Acidobacteria bacterium]|nr:hypothetical protein [Acidobacteriota bacterium]MBI3655894.1 hypothetical protein [Acidobacteriota bacterium]
MKGGQELLKSGSRAEFIRRFRGSAPAAQLNIFYRWTGRDLGDLHRLALGDPFSLKPPTPAELLSDPSGINRWHGKNLMPPWLPWLSRFEKVFFRHGAQFFGHNRTTYMRLAGPGYFQALTAGDAPEITRRYGIESPELHLLFDYTSIPPGEAQRKDLPPIRDNQSCPIRVFADLRDFVIFLDRDLLVGPAFGLRNPAKPIGFFALLRHNFPEAATRR